MILCFDKPYEIIITQYQVCVIKAHSHLLLWTCLWTGLSWRAVYQTCDNFSSNIWLFYIIIDAPFILNRWIIFMFDGHLGITVADVTRKYQKNKTILNYTFNEITMRSLKNLLATAHHQSPVRGNNPFTQLKTRKDKLNTRNYLNSYWLLHLLFWVAIHTLTGFEIHWGRIIIWKHRSTENIFECLRVCLRRLFSLHVRMCFGSLEHWHEPCLWSCNPGSQRQVGVIINSIVFFVLANSLAKWITLCDW